MPPKPKKSSSAKRLTPKRKAKPTNKSGKGTVAFKKTDASISIGAILKGYVIANKTTIISREKLKEFGVSAFDLTNKRVVFNGVTLENQDNDTFHINY